MASPAEDVPDAVCGACKQVMLDVDDVTPRKADKVGHRCDVCKCPLHAPMVCEAVWFPTVSSNGREFCCLEHLRAYNADCADWAIVPVRRRQECPIVDSADEG
eukprot:5872768-Pleurochrysis_carterae.AAC.1